MSFIRPVVLALAGVPLACTFSTSTSYCYDNDPFPDDCWANRPTTTEQCTPSSGNAICKCANQTDNACNIGLTADGATGRCAEIHVYIEGEQAERHGSEVGVSGRSKDMFCSSMVLNDQWHERGLVATTPEARDKVQWGWVYYCPSRYTSSWWGVFSDGQCHRKERFLGESCWQAWGVEGTCRGSDTSYGEYSTACYEGQCVPYANVTTRSPCECSWVGANLFVVCSAANDACDGHACVLNTGDGNHYCDYATSQNWQTLFSR